MMFDKIKIFQIRSEEIAELVSRGQALTNGSYDLWKQNYSQLASILKKLLKLAKQEREWYLYFCALYELMYLNEQEDNWVEIVKYAEVYYRDSEEHMDREIPNYPDYPMARSNIWIYDLIFEAYYQYYQIDDAKMEAFMEKFKAAVFKYGMVYSYYNAELYLSILYKDADRAEVAAQKFLAYEYEIISCYVCAHTSYLDYLLLIGQRRSAENLMLEYIHKKIPKKYLWCYKYCRRAEPDAMYLNAMEVCVRCGRRENFLYFYKKYWMELPLETRLDADANAFQRLLSAFGGCFDQLENTLETAVEWIDKENKDTTVNNMYTFLELQHYFTLLDQSGVHTVKVSFPGLETDETGQASTQCVIDYIREKADAYGEKFAQRRRQFDYEFVKDSYQKCFMQSDKV